MSTFNPQRATFAKLQDGTWGIKVPGLATSGEQIEVEKRDGSRQLHTIGEVVWTGQDRYGAGEVSLCTMLATPRKSRRARRSPSSDGYVRDEEDPIDCGDRDYFRESDTDF